MLAPIAPSAPVQPLLASAATPGSGAPVDAPAEFRARRPWLVGRALSLVPAVFPGMGFGLAAANGLDERAQTLGAAAGATFSALVGLLVMWRSRPSTIQFGFRSPRDLAKTWWLAPALVVPFVVLAATGVTVSGALVPGLVWLSLAAGLNEEVWFRGLVLAVFRPAGPRYAVVASSGLFGLLHLTNLLGGKSLGYAVLQLLFAVLFGVVVALLVGGCGSATPSKFPTALLKGTVTIDGAPVELATRAMQYSSRPGEHVLDLFGGSGSAFVVLNTAAVVGLSVQCAILAGYAVVLWRRLPR